MPRAWSLLNRVVVSGSDRFGVRWVRLESEPLHGAAGFSFYRPRESTGYSGGKEKNEREKKAFRITGSFFFMWVPPILYMLTGIALRRGPVCH